MTGFATGANLVGLVIGFFLIISRTPMSILGWFLVVLCGLMSVVGYLTLRAKSAEALAMERSKTTKLCPECAEEIKIEARKCKHCGEAVA